MNATTPSVSYPPPPPVARTSGLAITSLVLGICSLGCSFLTAIPALIFGGIALANINRPGGAMLGRGQAITGMVLGGVSLLLAPFLGIVAALVIPAVSTARGRAQEVACMSNAREIGAAVQMYAAENGDRMPAKLEDLAPYYFDKRPPDEWLRCPAQDSRERPAGTRSYVLTPNMGKLSELTPDTVIVQEVPGNHREGRRATLFADGHVEMRTD